MSRYNSKETLFAARVSAEHGSNELWNDHHKREELKLEQQRMLLDFAAMPFGEKKKQLGREIDAKNREISTLSAKIKEGGRNITDMFRGTAGMILPKHVYSQVLDEVNKVIRDSKHQPKIINVLTSEEEEYIIKGKAYDTDIKSLRDKISMARRRINELMPNFLGALEPEEYDTRLKKVKELKSILKELL